MAVGIIEYGDEAVITEFTMSCRVMGRKIEDAIVTDFEDAAKKRGYKQLKGIYIPTEKNKPVRDLYPSLGYSEKKTSADGTAEYVADLEEKRLRRLYVEKISEENQ